MSTKPLREPCNDVKYSREFNPSLYEDSTGISTMPPLGSVTNPFIVAICFRVNWFAFEASDFMIITAGLF